jgi:HPt (histidine-containing phosphotransfer) domain-containing protein
MDGIETVSRIRKLPDLTAVPIVALTANAISGAKEMFLEKGFNDFMSKPIDIVKMSAVLEKWLPKEKREKNISKKNSPFKSSEKNILSIFLKDGRDKINELKNCVANNNFPLYKIYVHALKSASANIGATDLADFARTLESACERGDYNFVKKHNDELILSVENLLKKIAVKINEDETAQENIDTSLLKTELAKLSDAIKTENLREIKSAVKSVRPFGRIAEDIVQCASVGEYERALQMIEKILQE